MWTKDPEGFAKALDPTHGTKVERTPKQKPVSKKKKKPDSPLCPKCYSSMKLRNGPYGEFWGCSKYPNCKGTRKP